MFIHTVLLSYAPSMPVNFHDDVRAFSARVLRECDGVVHYFYGPNEADRAGIFSHAVIGCFVDKDAHERYQTSPVHTEMKNFMAKKIDQLVVFDSNEFT